MFCDVSFGTSLTREAGHDRDKLIATPLLQEAHMTRREMKKALRLAYAATDSAFDAVLALTRKLPVEQPSQAVPTPRPLAMGDSFHFVEPTEQATRVALAA
jgi:hypothetical protein